MRAFLVGVCGVQLGVGDASAPACAAFRWRGREMSSTGIAYAARLTLQLLCLRYSFEDVASPKTEKFWASIMVDNH